MAAYMRGQFGLQSVAITTGPFLFYVIGVFGFGMRDLLNRAFHATEDTRTPMVNSAITVVMNIVLNLWLVRVMGASGLALATSISGVLGAAMLFIRLRKKLGRMGGQRTVEEILKILICTVVCALVCLTLNRLLPISDSSLVAMARLVLTAIVSLGVYIVLAAALGVRQLKQMGSLLFGKMSRT